MAIEWAQELNGRGGATFGTEAYIAAVNKECLLDQYLLSNSRDFQYERAIKKKCDTIKRALDEIYEDLKKNLETIYLLGQDERSNLMRFIQGLDRFLKWKGAGYQKTRECVSILSQDRSKAYQRASEREIREGAKRIRDGVRGNKLSLGERERLLEKARSSGLRAAERDTAKTAFLAAVIGKFDPQFLEAVYQCYQAVYHSYQHAVGRRGKKLCSEEYIQYYESSIFSKNVPDRYIGNRYDYLGFFQRRLQEVGKRILEDLRRGTPGKHWVKEENQKRVRAWAEELRKVGVLMPEFEERTLDFFLEDRTDKLFGIMQEAVADGAEVRKKLYVCRFPEFVNLVGGNKKYDIKNRDDWKDPWYYFDGYLLRFDDPGNIVYGVILKEAFADVTSAEFIGHAGAGVAQIADNVIKPIAASWKEADEKYVVEHPEELFYDKLEKEYPFIRILHFLHPPLSGRNAYDFWNTDFCSANYEVFSYGLTGFDDPRDYEAVELGYDYYDRLYAH